MMLTSAFQKITELKFNKRTEA